MLICSASRAGLLKTEGDTTRYIVLLLDGPVRADAGPVSALGAAHKFPLNRHKHGYRTHW